MGRAVSGGGRSEGLDGGTCRVNCHRCYRADRDRADCAEQQESRGLKVVSTRSIGGGNPNTATAKCPRGFVVVSGGFDGQQVDVRSSSKQRERRWKVTAVQPSTKRGALVNAQAVCVKGTGGFLVRDGGDVAP